MASLKNQAVNSVKLTSISMLVTSVLQIAQLLILGRVLGPEIFGLIAMVQIVIQFSQLFLEMGITDAIIQKEKVSKLELSSLYWFSLFVGVVLFLILLLAAPVIALLFNESSLTAMIQVVGISFLILPLGLQFQTLATKKLEFAQITKNEIFATAIGVLLTIYLAAFTGLGAWSLVYGHIATSLIRSIPWMVRGYRDLETRPQPVFSWTAIQGFVSFGMYRLGSTSINYFTTKIDQMIIGITLGPVALGYYSMAMNLIMQPVQKMNSMINRVAFPVFSKIQLDSSKLRRAYLLITNMLTSFNAPLLAGVIVSAPYAVPILLGTEWAESIVIIQILCLYGLFKALGNPSGSLFIAVGKVKWSFYWQLFQLGIIPVVVYLASLSGEIVIVALAVGLLRVVLFYISYFVRIRQIIGDSLAELTLSIIKPMVHSAIMLAPLYIINSQLTGMEPIAIIVIDTIIGGAIYGLLMILNQRELLMEMKSFFQKRTAVKGG
ncbi:PST family polysaccharide transporter/lipopolysaccharide exporter [Planomicrobium stackebrandtii]|uniref:PST family polysaccharide transporter/lipopolysaccharide exporter n=1 Tax=Planomicrobium stackebrandtii TaxID=253160 RepID=A0ABU0GVR5_9BACL|nr:MOP flippase family protein [Planomicrobium stackebrandtii]MDQ0428871.1 PST family polysaccharide transporter/lipopolysaccharide exporter [Planomicrobium stackebrandtii]